MKFNEIIDGVKDSINDTKLKVVKAVDDAELDKRAKEFGNVAGDKLKLLFCKWVVIIRLFTMFRAHCISISHSFWRQNCHFYKF